MFTQFVNIGPVASVKSKHILLLFSYLVADVESVGEQWFQSRQFGWLLPYVWLFTFLSTYLENKLEKNIYKNDGKKPASCFISEDNWHYDAEWINKCKNMSESVPFLPPTPTPSPYEQCRKSYKFFSQGLQLALGYNMQVTFLQSWKLAVYGAKGYIKKCIYKF